MLEVTQILNAIQSGDTGAAEDLLPAVYAELRRMAGYKMAGEAAGHTLQPTALVHEAWLRLAGSRQSGWESRSHFFAAAAEAMRRILVEHARRKQSLKRGGGAAAEPFDETTIQLAVPADELLAVHDALDQLAAEDPQAAQLVKLRYFVGMTMAEVAEATGTSLRAAERTWTYARVWLRHHMRSQE